MKQIILSLISPITGFLSNLTTTAKNNLVAAINELNARFNSSFLITVTKAEADTLIAGSGLLAGRNYKITGVDTDLYGGTDIILKAASTTLFETKGSGFFYNPKYTQDPGWGIWTKYMESDTPFSSVVGTFDYLGREGVTAQNGATGILLADGFIEWVSGGWSAATSITGDTSAATATVTGFTSPSYAINDNVIWGGKHWVNVAGNIGNADDDFELDAEWAVVAFDATDYNLVNDVIEYDYENDVITRLADTIGNYVRGNSAIKVFQWGNNVNIFNTVLLGSVNSINTLGSFSNNTLNGGAIENNIMGKSTQIKENSLSQQTAIINANVMTGSSEIANNTLIGGGIESCILSNNSKIGDNCLNGYQAGIISLIMNNSRVENNYAADINYGAGIRDTTLNNSAIGDNFFHCGWFNFGNSIMSGSNIRYATLNSLSDYSVVTDISGAIIIFGNYTKTIFTRQDGTPRLSYYDNTDTIQIVDVDA